MLPGCSDVPQLRRALTELHGEVRQLTFVFPLFNKSVSGHTRPASERLVLFNSLVFIHFFLCSSANPSIHQFQTYRRSFSPCVRWSITNSSISVIRPSLQKSFSSSVHLSICPSIQPSISQSIHLHPSISPSVFLFIRPLHPSFSPFVHLSIHPSFHLSIYPTVHPSIRPSPSVHLSIRPSFHPSFSLSVHLSIGLSLRLSTSSSVLLSAYFLYVCLSILMVGKFVRSLFLLPTHPCPASYLLARPSPTHSPPPSLLSSYQLAPSSSYPLTPVPLPPVHSIILK